MNAGFELKTSDELKGVGLFATKDYNEGDIILEEKPLVAAQFCWNEHYSYQACHHCLRPLETAEENVRRLTNNPCLVLPLPDLCSTDKSQHRFCDSCGVHFCSEACKSSAVNQYHERLCAANLPSVDELNHAWREIHYPPETSSITLLTKIIATVEQSDNKELAIATFLEFVHGISDNNECVLLKLFGSANAEKLASLYSKVEKAFPLNSSSFVSEDGLRTLLALVGRNGQGIGTSPFSEWVKNVEKKQMSPDEREKIDKFIDNVYEAMDNHVGSFLNAEGSGLYKMQRCINHSCKPNAVVTFPYSNSMLVLVAQEKIETGHEICISYLDDCFLKRSRHSRNKELMSYYLFKCSCSKCLNEANDPDVTSDEESNESDELMEEED